MSQNLVIPNKDNKVIMVFGGIDLTLATDIVVNFGAETYSKISTPLSVQATATELTLDLSGTAEAGRVFVTVTYFDSGSVNGTDITSQELGNSTQIVVAIGTQLIVEDGSQVAKSNSLVSDDEYKAYASLNNLTVAATQPDREADLLSAMNWIMSKESSLQGRRVSSTQSMLFPRVGMELYGYYIKSDNIPENAKKAQMEAAAYNTSNSILNNSTSSNIQSESVDTLSVTYFKGGKRSNVNLQRVNLFLDPLMEDLDKLVRV